MRWLRTALIVPALVSAGTSTFAHSIEEALQQRMATDVAAGRPIVAHVVVALCDNQNQGIVPVPAHLGNGQDPGSNLYWGALYGVRTHLTGTAGWRRMPSETSGDDRVLERIVLERTVQREGQNANVYLVADAWDGAHIREAVTRFLRMAAGRAGESVSSGSRALAAGGNAHLVGYVGHNGLMDFGLPVPAADLRAPSRSAIVLACASKPYFVDILRAAGAFPLLLTTGLMAPEAYTLDAVVASWAGGAAGPQVRDAAARAYHRYQKCGLTAARRLFWSGTER